ncbi:hypothetical protein ABK040_008356 [Willaertia magna]
MSLLCKCIIFPIISFFAMLLGIFSINYSLWLLSLDTNNLLLSVVTNDQQQNTNTGSINTSNADLFFNNNYSAMLTTDFTKVFNLFNETTFLARRSTYLNRFLLYLTNNNIEYIFGKGSFDYDNLLGFCYNNLTISLSLLCNGIVMFLSPLQFLSILRKEKLVSFHHFFGGIYLICLFIGQISSLIYFFTTILIDKLTTFYFSFIHFVIIYSAWKAWTIIAKDRSQVKKHQNWMFLNVTMLWTIPSIGIAWILYPLIEKIIFGKVTICQTQSQVFQIDSLWNVSRSLFISFCYLNSTITTTTTTTQEEKQITKSLIYRLFSASISLLISLFVEYYLRDVTVFGFENEFENDTFWQLFRIVCVICCFISTFIFLNLKLIYSFHYFITIIVTIVFGLIFIYNQEHLLVEQLNKKQYILLFNALIIAFMWLLSTLFGFYYSHLKTNEKKRNYWFVTSLAFCFFPITYSFICLFYCNPLLVGYESNSVMFYSFSINLVVAFCYCNK